MALYMATAFFQQEGYGWTESYFRDSQEVTDLAALADFDRNNIWNLRAVALAKQASIRAQRASFVTVKGDSVLNNIRIAGNDTWESEDANTAVLVRLGNIDNTKRKNVFMRGVPDDMVVNGGRVGNATGWKNAADAFFNKIIELSYGWLGIQTRIDIPVTGYTVNAQQKVVITLDDTPVLAGAVPSKMVLQGVNMGVGQPSVLNGNHPYIKTGTAEVTTAKKTAVFPFPGLGGFLRTLTKDLVLAKNVRYQKIDTRKAGKISGLQAGRSRVKPKG